MSAHTPGPWHWDDDPSTPYDKNNVAPWLVNDKGEAIISGAEIEVSNRKDARLIVAAPELLEALKELEFAVRHDLPSEHRLDAARTAIAKAEGRE